MDYDITAAIIVMLVMLFCKVPIFVALLSGAMTYFVVTPSVSSSRILVQRMLTGVESIPLLAVPFFVCAGVFMNSAGVTKRVMQFAMVLTGRLRGGLAQVNVMLSTLMGGLSGSNLADAAMSAKMIVPEMERHGYSKPFSTVVTATSALITPLIPPGIGMILYGSIANVSIGKLFVSGLGIGLFLTFALMILVSIIAKKRGYQPLTTDPFTLKAFWDAFKEAFLPLCLPVIIIGGIRMGVCTPTEAGAVAVAYAMFLGFLYREMTFKDVLTGLRDTVITTSSIMLIVGAASALAWVLTKERIPQELTEYMISTVSNKYIFLLLVNLFLLAVGMFVEGNAITLVLVPLLVPIARRYGIDDIQFAMTFIFNLSIGNLTPPLGTVMFVTCGITGCKISSFIKEAMPFFLMLLACLMVITFIPVISTGLVSLIY